MPNSIDYALSRERPGRGGAFKPLVPPKQQRSLAAIIADTDPALWLAAISTTLDAGHALLLSPTSDGGAFSFTILAGDDRVRSYCATSDEITNCITAILRYGDPDGASGGTTQPRPRRRTTA